MFAIDARRKRDVDVWGNDEEILTVRKISKHRKVLSANCCTDNDGTPD
jgi:hypothetical protein